MGVWVRGHDVANFSQISKDPQENSTSFDTNVVVVGVGANKKTPTPIGTTNAFSKILQTFQNPIPRELDQKLDIPRISMIH